MRGGDLCGIKLRSFAAAAAGVTVNNQPYLNLTLEVDDGSRAPYVVSFDTVIPRAAVPRFQPDALIRLKVDPNDTQQVVIDWSASRLVT